MQLLLPYHHFKKDLIPANDRVSRYEHYVVELLLKSKLLDSKRESSVVWELKHQAGVALAARILSAKRNLSTDICVVGSVLHDIYSIAEGKYADHAHKGAQLAHNILAELGGFSPAECNLIENIVYHHSDKHLSSDDPYKEIGKDADILDCFLYQQAFQYYLGNKSLVSFTQYLNRAKLLWNSLDIPLNPAFDCLNGYTSEWFSPLASITSPKIADFLTAIFSFNEFKESGQPDKYFPPFCILNINENVILFGRQLQWKELLANLGKSSMPKAYLTFVNIFCSLLSKDNSSEMNDISDFVPESATSKLAIVSDVELNFIEKKQKIAYLIWPAAEMFEILEGNSGAKRLSELLPASWIKGLLD